MRTKINDFPQRWGHDLWWTKQTLIKWEKKKRTGASLKLHALPICFGGSFTSGRFPMELLSVAAKMSPSALWCADLRLFDRLI